MRQRWRCAWWLGLAARASWPRRRSGRARPAPTAERVLVLVLVLVKDARDDAHQQHNCLN